MHAMPENPLLGASTDAVLDEMQITEADAPVTRKIARAWLNRLQPHEIACNCKDRRHFIYRLFCRFISWMGAGHGETR